MEEKPVSKDLYKIAIWLLKLIPFILALFNFLNTILTCFNIVLPFIVELASISFIPLIFIYVASYLFKFCKYHRVPLHYVATNKVLNLFDYYFQIPVSDYNWFIFNSILFGFFAIMCGILKLFKKI